MPSEHSVALGLLGGFRLTVAGAAAPLSAGGQRVVALLALARRPMGRGDVSAALWPAAAARRAEGNLRTALWRLRGAAPGIVQAGGGRLALDPCVHVDVWDETARMRRLLQELEDGDGPDGSPDPARLLPGWEDPWLAADRERLRQLSAHLLEATASRLAGDGRWQDAHACAVRAMAEGPARETSARILAAATARLEESRLPPS